MLYLGSKNYVPGQKNLCVWATTICVWAAKKLFGHLGRPDKRNNAFFHLEDTYGGAFHYRTRVY
jgi:hypothetical protein